MVMIMGTSVCHMVCGREKKIVEGMCGVVKDGILPGLYGFEAGQSAVGDIYAWFVENCVPPAYHKEAKEKGVSLHELLEKKAARLKVGQSGLLALDWWNGNRSILVDTDLTGLLLGMTLATKPEEIYRALIEATAFGTMKIINAFESSGVKVDEIYCCGGLAQKNEMLMQIFADVTGRTLKVADSLHTSALGSAMFAAVAAGREAGGYDTIAEAARAMTRIKRKVYKPDNKNNRTYRELFKEYEALHDYFGRGDNDVMKRLKKIKAAATAG
jgi:L-ribulokinase